MTLFSYFYVPSYCICFFFFLAHISFPSNVNGGGLEASKEPHLGNLYSQNPLAASNVSAAHRGFLISVLDDSECMEPSPLPCTSKNRLQLLPTRPPGTQLPVRTLTVTRVIFNPDKMYSGVI